MPASNATALPRAAPYDAAATGGGGAGGGGEVDPDVVASIADILPHLPRARIRDAPRVEDQVERAAMQAGEEPEERARHVSQRAEPALGQRLVRLDGQRTRFQACGGNAGARSDGHDR